MVWFVCLACVVVAIPLQEMVLIPTVFTAAQLLDQLHDLPLVQVSVADKNGPTINTVRNLPRHCGEDT